MAHPMNEWTVPTKLDAESTWHAVRTPLQTVNGRCQGPQVVICRPIGSTGPALPDWTAAKFDRDNIQSGVAGSFDVPTANSWTGSLSKARSSGRPRPSGGRVRHWRLNTGQHPPRPAHCSGIPASEPWSMQREAEQGLDSPEEVPRMCMTWGLMVSHQQTTTVRDDAF